METGPGATAVLEALERALEDRVPSVAVLTLSDARCSTTLAVPGEDGEFVYEPAGATSLAVETVDAAWRALAERRLLAIPSPDGELPRQVLSPICPLPRLTIFGAGDDAKPLVRFAVELGWEVTVADGRSHLLRRDRFPEAARFSLLHYDVPTSSQTTPPSDEPYPVLISQLTLEPDEFSVILTHSLNQDRALLRALLPLPQPYLGLL